MSPDPDRLSNLSTSWALLRQAHACGVPEQEQASARRALVERYHHVVRRYLGGALRRLPEDHRQEALDECYQCFCVRLLDGRFGGATPQRGRRFRDYVRKVLSNLVNDYWRERRQQPTQLAEIEVAVEDWQPDDAQFGEWCLENLVLCALEELRRQDERMGRSYHTVLCLHREHPDWTAEQIATALSRPDRPHTAGWVRVNLHRGREHLWHLLRREVAAELDDASPEQVDEELGKLGLLAYRP
jgi:RNA polymerase sigma factor (sigma-70 family)